MEEQNNEEREEEEVIHVSCNFMTAAVSGLNLTTFLCAWVLITAAEDVHSERTCLFVRLSKIKSKIT